MNISVKLNKNFTTQFNKLLEQYGEEMAYLNGFGDKQLSYTDFIDNFVDKEVVADASTDGNANVSQKNITTLLNEMAKPHQKLLSFNKIYHEMNKKYGFKAANAFLESDYTGKSYLHDANSTSFIHYCYAYDLKDLAEKGLFFIDGFNAEPPKHLSTFVAFCREFTAFGANSSSGAVGLPNLIPYMYYFWDRDVKNGHYLKTPEYYAKQAIQELVYTLNQPYLRGNTQSAFTNVTFFDHEYLEALFGGAIFPDGKPMIDEIDEIMDFQKMFLEVMSEIRSKNMMTFPVSTISLLYKDGKFVDEEFARWACEHNRKWNDSNFFCDSSVTSLSNCCRLKSNIENLGYFNSIGGSALRVGSVKVNTINLARIAYDSDGDEERYISILKERLVLCMQVLDCVRYIIQRNIEKGLLKNFISGMVDMKTLYNTIGIIGVYETMKTFGYVKTDEFGYNSYSDKAYEFGKRIFDTINEIKAVFLEDKDYQISVEQIPGETAAAKLMKKDLFFYPRRTISDLPLYGNQFMPLGVKATLKNRVYAQAMFDSYCGGGSILHANFDAPFNSEQQAWDMLNYIASNGVTYFAFCTKISACEHNHGFYGKICPECGGPMTTTYQRIVGFLTATKTYSKERRDEFYMRQWEEIK